MSKTILTILFCTNLCFSEYYENAFESQDYVILFRMSISYSSIKMKIEKIIENKIKKPTNYFINNIEQLRKINSNAIKILENIYGKYQNSVIRSQIYQIRFEVDELNKIITDLTKKWYDNKKISIKEMTLVEKKIYRLEIYFKGLSNTLSEL